MNNISLVSMYIAFHTVILRVRFPEFPSPPAVEDCVRNDLGGDALFMHIYSREQKCYDIIYSS
jgi:hypothetical protein